MTISLSRILRLGSLLSRLWLTITLVSIHCDLHVTVQGIPGTKVTSLSPMMTFIVSRVPVCWENGKLCHKKH